MTANIPVCMGRLTKQASLQLHELIRVNVTILWLNAADSMHTTTININ